MQDRVRIAVAHDFVQFVRPRRPCAKSLQKEVFSDGGAVQRG